MGADLTVIIVNWNTVGLLDACIASVHEDATDVVDFDIVVVDNGSSDGSTEHLRRRWPEVRVLAQTENLGFTKANNLAIEATDSRLVLLLNTDARLASGCLDALVARLERDPRAAAVGPRLVYGDGSFQRFTAGRTPTLASCAAFYTSLDCVLSRISPALGVYLGADVADAFTPDWVSSACMLVRREALADVGPLNETYFCYMDDVDLCDRLRAAGWRVWYEPAGTAVHLMGQSSSGPPGAASREALRSFTRYFAAKHSPAATAAMRAVQSAGFAGRVVVHGAKGVTDQRSRQRAVGHWHNFWRSLEPVD